MTRCGKSALYQKSRLEQAPVRSNLNKLSHYEEVPILGQAKY